MAYVVIDKYGDKRYFNMFNQLHREDGPAVIYKSGGKSWRVNDKLRREDGPTVYYATGAMYWNDMDGFGGRNDYPNGYSAQYRDGRVLWPKF